jgi:hypothetical protein
MNLLECPDCNNQPFSLSDRMYIRLFNTCWDCDKLRWESGKLKLEEFEKRETSSVDMATKTLK